MKMTENHDASFVKASDLPLGKRIRFRIFGRVYLEHRQHEGWSGPNPFYLANCPEHGPFRTIRTATKRSFDAPNAWNPTRAKWWMKMTESHDTSIVEARAALPLDGGVKCYGGNRSVLRGETGN